MARLQEVVNLAVVGMLVQFHIVDLAAVLEAVARIGRKERLR